MLRWTLLLIPQMLYAQTECMGTHTVQSTAYWKRFTDKGAFEQELLSTARVKLVHETVGTNIQQSVRIYKEGSKTVYIMAQSNTVQELHANIVNECYTISYDGRDATIVLSGTATTRNGMSRMTYPSIIRNAPPNPPKLMYTMPFVVAYIISFM